MSKSFKPFTSVRWLKPVIIQGVPCIDKIAAVYLYTYKPRRRSNKNQPVGDAAVIFISNPERTIRVPLSQLELYDRSVEY